MDGRGIDLVAEGELCYGTLCDVCSFHHDRTVVCLQVVLASRVACARGLRVRHVSRGVGTVVSRRQDQSITGWEA